MKKHGNYFQLLKYHNELEDLRENDSVFYNLFNSRINDFYNAHNSARIASVNKELLTLQKKYFEVDAEGNAKYEQPIKDSKIITMFKQEKKTGKQQQPIMLPGMKMEDYEKEFKEIMGRKVEIIF